MDINKHLLKRYYSGHCNDGEKQLVEEWLMEYAPFKGDESLADTNGAKNRMWNNIQSNTIGINVKNQCIHQYLAVACAVILLLVAGLYSWNTRNILLDEHEYVVIDNTSKQLLHQAYIGKLRLSESANGGLQTIHPAKRNGSQLFTNSLIIDNQNGEDIWVYLKTSNEKGSGMVKFLCKKKRTYVAGYITEYTEDGTRKYLYSKETGVSRSLPEEVYTSINSQLHTAKKNTSYERISIII